MKLLEVCVDSLASARAAIAGGADRLELCSALSVGGLTPYAALLTQIRQESDIPIRCMIRPRPGDFLYAPDEVAMMTAQIQELSRKGSNGFVIGCLTPDGDLDRAAMASLIDAADGAGLTIHRCIDVSRDPEETYALAGELGIDTVLTSGAAASCRDGKQVIGTLLARRDQQGGPEVLIGSGVSAALITEFLQEFPTARAFHLSGKKDVESGMRFRRKNVPMGLPGLDEWHIPTTSAELVRKAKNALCS